MRGALQEGQHLGPYVVEGLLGRGGMALVYRGRHVTLDRAVAIKVLSPELHADPTFPLRFLREAKVSARLNHPNIVTVYDFGEQGEIAYLVMELATGGTFQDLVGRFPTLGAAIEGLAPVSDALGYAHGLGFVHRDVKPENILLDEQQRALLADFGLARIAAESLDVGESGMIVGTPLYMAPEQAMGDRVDQRADIYALGIIAYTVITGQAPYHGNTFFAIIQQHIKSPPPSLRALLPDVPERVDAAVQRATAKRADARFQTVAEFISELRAALNGAADLPVGDAAVVRAASADRRPTPSAVQRPPDKTMQTPDAIKPAFCTSCGDTLTATDRFCRQCGTSRAVAPSDAAPAGADDRTVLMSPATVLATGPTPAPNGGPTLIAPPPPNSKEGFLPAAAPRRRRATAFTPLQVALFAAAAVIVIFINGVGLWLTRSGRATADDFLPGLTTYIYDHLPWFKSWLTLAAVLLAGAATLLMRSVVVDTHSLTAATYRRLRRLHRVAGYVAVVIAFAIGLLTCVGIFGFAVDTPRRAIHSTLGTALLVLIVFKIAIVRYLPALRQHLKLLGQGVFVLFVLVFATSAVAWTWEELTGEGGSGYQYDGPVGR